MSISKIKINLTVFIVSLIILLVSPIASSTPNYALNKGVNVSSEPDPGGGNKNWLTDGSYLASEQWYSDAVQPQWAYVNLNASYTINNATIYHSSSGATYITIDYKIAYSNSSSGAWTTAVTITGNTLNNVSHNFSSINAQYWMINTTNPGSADARTRLRELEFRFEPPPVADTLNISLGSIANNTQYNYNTLNFNLTANSTTNFNATLYINNTVNQTFNYTNGTNVFVSFNVTFADAAYSYRVNVTNSADSEVTSTNEFFIDTSLPTLATSFLNNTIVFLSNLTGEFNFSDNFLLYSYNFTIDGLLIRNSTNLATTFLQYNLSYNVSNLTAGAHNLSARFADGHTARELGGAYDYTNGLFDDYLRYDFYDGGFAKIRPLYGSIFDSFSTDRMKDRYTFQYEPTADTLSEYVFVVESDSFIDIIIAPDTQYESWLILGNHWLDFELPDEPDSKVAIKRITSTEVQVTVSGIKNPTLQQYSSIGDLNVVTRNFIFTTTNASVTYSSSVSELENQSILLRINTTGAINSTNASLTWNHTAISAIKTILSNFDLYTATFLTPSITEQQANVSFNWNYSIFGSIMNETGSLPFNQTIYRIGIDNCSTFTTRAINMSILNETDDGLVNGTVDGFFRTWISSISDYRPFNLTWSGDSQYGLCIDPPSAEYITYAQLEYGAPEFETKTYYSENRTLDNSTELLNLYLTDSTTNVVFTVTDQNDNPVEGVFIYIMSYDLPTDTATTTEIIKTDSNGEALGRIVLNTKWYKFILIYNNVIVLETTETKITTTTPKFRINLGDDYFETYDVVEGTTCAITYTNSTLTFEFTFANPSSEVAQGCLDIDQVSINGVTDLNNSCAIGSSGSVSYTLNNTGTNTYLASSTILINGNTFVCGTPVSASFDTSYLDFGLSGIFFSLFIILTLVLIGIWSPTASVALLIVGVIVVNVMGLFFMNLPILIAFIIVGGIVLYRLSR